MYIVLYMVGEFVSLGLMFFGAVLTISGMAVLAKEIRRLEMSKNDKRKKLNEKIIEHYFYRERPLNLDYWGKSFSLFLESLCATEWKSWRPFLLITIGLASFICGIFVY